MDLSKLLELLQQQQREQMQNIKASSAQMSDRIKMANPEIQGPRLPEGSTPEEEGMMDSMMAMVGGTVSSGPKFGRIVKALSKAEDAAPAAAQKLNVEKYMQADAGKVSRANELAMPTQKLSRSEDYKNRTAQALRNVQAQRRAKLKE